jgi:hypothetical protein
MRLPRVSLKADWLDKKLQGAEEVVTMTIIRHLAGGLQISLHEVLRWLDWGW